VAYQLSDLISKVQRRIRDTGYSTAEITDYLNDTQNDIYNEYRLPFMQTYVDYVLFADVPDITNGSGLLADYVQAVDLQITTEGKEAQLIYMPYEEIFSMYPNPDDTTAYPPTIPKYWYFYDETIKVFPASSENLTVRLHYYKKPAELAISTDVPSIPSQFSELLVVGAAYRVLQVKDNYDQAGVLQNKYDELLQKLVVKYSVPQTGRALRMRINRFAPGKQYF
jgi:hypothetical protein